MSRLDSKYSQTEINEIWNPSTDQSHCSTVNPIITESLSFSDFSGISRIVAFKYSDWAHKINEYVSNYEQLTER